MTAYQGTEKGSERFQKKKDRERERERQREISIKEQDRSTVKKSLSGFLPGSLSTLSLLTDRNVRLPPEDKPRGQAFPLLPALLPDSISNSVVQWPLSPWEEGMGAEPPSLTQGTLPPLMLHPCCMHLSSIRGFKQL